MVFCCSVCQEQLQGRPVSDWSDGAGGGGVGNGDPKICAVKCGHIFHYECIRQWWLTLFRGAGVTRQPPPNFQPRVRCPVCRQQNVAQLFEIHLISEDDSLYPTENEIYEATILNHNILEIDEEVKGVKRRMEICKRKIASHEITIALIEAEVEEIIMERDKYLTLVDGQKSEKPQKPKTSKRVLQNNNSRESKIPKNEDEILYEIKQIQPKRIKAVFGERKSRVLEGNRYNLRLRRNCCVA